MTKAIYNQISKAAAKGNTEKIHELLAKENFHAIAELINTIPSYKYVIFSVLEPEKQAKVMVALNKKSKHAIIPKLSDENISDFLKMSDEDDATDILHYIPNEKRPEILKALAEEKRQKVETLLKHHPESAGAIMQMSFIIVKRDFTLKDVASKIERFGEREHKSPLVVVARDDGSIAGYIPYRNLIMAKPESLVKDVTKSIPLISDKTKQKQLIHILAGDKSEVIGVVDQDKQLLGAIFAKDLMYIVEAEATKNIYQFAGVSREEEMVDPPMTAVKSRYGWLIVNLGTAFMAAFVVSLFEDTIARLAVLATFMPIVAGMGGNAGTQSLAVVIRGIALGQLEWVSAQRIVAKEVTAGLVNGAIIALVTIPVSLFFTSSIMLSLVLGAAMVINLIVAGFFGAVIPLTLKFFKIDPAVASSVFVTTATDVFGFLAFLGLASLVL